MVLWKFQPHMSLDHMGLEISKRHSSYSFHLWCQSNFMRTLATMVEYRLLPFLAIGQIWWHFEILIWESMEKQKYGISRKRLIVEWSGQKFGTRGPKVHICRVRLMPDFLSLVWGHSVHFTNFPILRFSILYLSNNFHRIPSKLYENIVYHGGMQAITVLGNRPSFTKFVALWSFNIEVKGKT